MESSNYITITIGQVPYRILHNIPMVTARFEEIRLLFADLDVLEENIDEFLPLLSADEITRANSYVAPLHQKRFTSARGLLRIVLGACLGIAPWEIMFSYNPYGKPFINGSLNNRDLRFNLAHSGAAAVIALTIGCEVGVDIEKIRPVAEMDQIAETIFTPLEKEFFDTAEGSKKQMLFFTYWTRKEATVKAAGHGLAQPLGTIDVSACPANPVLAPGYSGSSSGYSKYFIQDFAFTNNYSASIAVAQYPRKVLSFYINWNL